MTNVYRTSLPIAQLRDMGAKVSTVLGHNPKMGYWIYAVTLPKDIDARALRTAVAPKPGHGAVKPAPYDEQRTLIFYHNTHRLDWTKGGTELAAVLRKAARFVADARQRAAHAENLKELGLF
jgi:hypothetical protein